MREEGRKLIKELDKARIQAGVLRVFIEDERWDAAEQAALNHIDLLSAQIVRLKELCEELHTLKDER